MRAAASDVNGRVAPTPEAPMLATTPYPMLQPTQWIGSLHGDPAPLSARPARVVPSTQTDATDGVAVAAPQPRVASESRATPQDVA